MEMKRIVDENTWERNAILILIRGNITQCSPLEQCKYFYAFVRKHLQHKGEENVKEFPP